MSACFVSNLFKLCYKLLHSSEVISLWSSIKCQVGLLYDEVSLQKVLDMTADWTAEERQMLRNKVIEKNLYNKHLYLLSIFIFYFKKKKKEKRKRRLCVGLDTLRKAAFRRFLIWLRQVIFSILKFVSNRHLSLSPLPSPYFEYYTWWCL